MSSSASNVKWIRPRWPTRPSASIWSNGDGGGAISSYKLSPLYLLGNRRIGILLTHNNEPLFLPISRAENTWLRIQGPLKQKAAVANRTEEECTSAA